MRARLHCQISGLLKTFEVRLVVLHICLPNATPHNTINEGGMVRLVPRGFVHLVWTRSIQLLHREAVSDCPLRWRHSHAGLVTGVNHSRRSRVTWNHSRDGRRLGADLRRCTLADWYSVAFGGQRTQMIMRDGSPSEYSKLIPEGDAWFFGCWRTC